MPSQTQHLTRIAIQYVLPSQRQHLTRVEIRYLLPSQRQHLTRIEIRYLLSSQRQQLTRLEIRYLISLHVFFGNMYPYNQLFYLCLINIYWCTHSSVFSNHLVCLLTFTLLLVLG